MILKEFRSIYYYLTIVLVGFDQVSCVVNLSQLLYDESYILDNLDDRFPYLKLPDGGYKPPRDHFNFSHVFRPTGDYLEKINIEEKLFHELRAMEFSSSIATMDQWHYTNEADLMNSGNPKATSVEQCAQDLAFIDGRLSQNNSDHLFSPGIDNMQFLRYIDAWGRPPSETYHGHSYWVGSYRACKLAHLDRSENLRLSPMKFHYCWGKLRAKSWPHSDEMVPPTSLRVGLCLPESCDTKLANRHNETIHRIMGFNFSPTHKDRFNQFMDIYCLPHQTGLPLRAKLFLFIVGSWSFFILSLSLVFATSPASTSERHPILKSITLQSSYRRFISDDTPKVSASGDSSKRVVDIRSLSLVRLFGSVAVCLGHTGCSFGWVFNSSSIVLIEYRKLIYHIMPSLLKSNDLFMVIGGLVTAFGVAKKFPGQSIRQILRPKIYLALWLMRYLRLAPMMILVLYFMKALYPSLSEGPMWDYGTYKFSMQGQCQRSSWLRVLVAPIMLGVGGNHYVSECLPVSWYLVADLKLALVAPLIIYLLHRLSSRALKWLTISLLVVISSLWQYHGYTAQKLIYFQQFFSYGQLFGVNILNLNFGETGYFNPINRLYAFAIGIYAGNALYNYQRAPKQSARWPNWMTGYCFWALLAYEIYDFFSPHLAQYNYLNTGHIPSEETIKLAMLVKPRIDAIIFAIVALRLASDLAPALMRTAMPLYKLSKLSYCVYLIHAIIISYAVSAHERSRPDSEALQFYILTVFVIAMSFIISFPLFLFFESPLSQLLSNFTPTNQRSKAIKSPLSPSAPTEQRRATGEHQPVAGIKQD